MKTKLNLMKKSESLKGAYLLTDGDVDFWVKPAAAKKFAEGKITASIQKAYDFALSNKKDGLEFDDIEVQGHVQKETEKAVYFSGSGKGFFDGNEACNDTFCWLPKSQIKKQNGTWFVIPKWLAVEKDLTYRYIKN